MRFALLRRTLPVLLVATITALALPAVARDHREHREYWEDRHERHHERGEDYRERRHERWEDHRERRHERWEDRRERRHERWEDRRDHRVRYVYRDVRYHGAPRVIHVRPGHHPPPRWARGYRIHDYGWAPTYVIVDYHHYGLRHPPRGHHWRRDDRGDWLLVAIATGLVVDVILNH